MSSIEHDEFETLILLKYNLSMVSFDWMEYIPSDVIINVYETMYPFFREHNPYIKRAHILILLKSNAKVDVETTYKAIKEALIEYERSRME